MRALVVTEPGRTPEVREHPDPEAVLGTTLVGITAAPVVPLDLLCASGTSYFGAPATPYVPGVQGVGRVLASETLAPGTRVWCAANAGMAPGDGTLAQFHRAAAQDLVVLPDTVAAVPDTTVAALGLSGVAAWMALSWRGALRPGEQVLVLGGGGAVGQAGIGAARALGASRVVAVARSGASAARASAAGADAVVPVEGEDLAGRCREALAAGGGPGTTDVVLDPVWGDPAVAASQVLAASGRLVNLGGSAGDAAALSSAALRSRGAAVLGYTNNALTPAQRADALLAVVAAAAAGTVRLAHDVRPLEEGAAVWESLAAGTLPVRTVLVP